MVKYLKGQDTLIKDPEVEAESDCEGDSTGVGLEKLKMEDEREETRLVLILGSFSAYVHLPAYPHVNETGQFYSWRSLFFYYCTDTILFAPLKSQGADFRLKYIRENTTAVAPPPCSPKSIYVLAKVVRQNLSKFITRNRLMCKSKLGIEPLHMMALEDIKSKVSLDNVVGEVFSRVPAGWVPSLPLAMGLIGNHRADCLSSSHEKIVEIECDLLTSNFRDPKATALVKDKIGHIFDGSLSQCAGSLKHGLKNAFEAKKTYPRLQCTNPFCEWHKNPVPYSSVAPDIYCPECNRGQIMQCTSCRSSRTNNDTRCQNCGNSFM